MSRFPPAEQKKVAVLVRAIAKVVHTSNSIDHLWFWPPTCVLLLLLSSKGRLDLAPLPNPTKPESASINFHVGGVIFGSPASSFVPRSGKNNSLNKHPKSNPHSHTKHDHQLLPVQSNIVALEIPFFSGKYVYIYIHMITYVSGHPFMVDFPARNYLKSLGDVTGSG